MRHRHEALQGRYIFLIVVLITNLVILSTNIKSLPWYSTSNLSATGLLMTTPILALFVLLFSQKDLSLSINQVKLAIPAIALLINGLNLLLSASEIKTDLSLLISILLIINAFSLLYPRRLGY
ncbi:hypothetical protein DOK76_01385 [Vagococcus sp. DIV0080]|uniref:Uncharacterized protein n=1 Tax=Candidatus Vagococcus giribetii TaxID=2230876 RepID=A0ABS3HPN2_9ENTE|nr:hypothetical protein [Vagococcus sp. DIV0080]MBO0475702.1 hypothetical protein [Vagococcus sp. DIV0080]